MDKAQPWLSEQVFLRDEAVLEDEFSGSRSADTQLLFLLTEGESRCILFNDDGTGAAGSSSFVRQGDNSIYFGLSAVGNELLGAVKQIAALHLFRRCLDVTGVGAGGRLGYGKGGELLAAGDIGEVLFLLFIGPEEDDKLQQLVAMMTEGRNLPGDLAHGKVLIFTQYADTAHYLYETLRHLGRIRAVESGTTDLGRVILRFAPKANNYQLRPGDEELRILVSTDVLSEGLNLQDANNIINYDLHWNPVRLIQRVGRVDRIGTEHDTIYAYNFLPETGLERELGIEQRLEHRITEIHRTIGEDAPVLHKSERINAEALYAIYRGDPSVLEDEPEPDIFNLLEVEELMRQLQRTDPDRFQQIATMPDGVRSARQAR